MGTLLDRTNILVLLAFLLGLGVMGCAVAATPSHLSPITAATLTIQPTPIPSPTTIATPARTSVSIPTATPTPEPIAAAIAAIAAIDDERLSGLQADVTLEVGQNLFRSLHLSQVEGGGLPGKTIEVTWVLASSLSKASVQHNARLQMVNILNDVYNSGIAYDVVHLRAMGTLRDGDRIEQVTMVFASYKWRTVDEMFDGRMSTLDMIGNIYKRASGVYFHPAFQE